MKKLIVLAIPFALLVAGCSKKEEATPSPKSADASKVQISVTEKGFEPDSVDVPAGKPVTIVFTRKTDKTCAKAVVVDLGGGKKVTKDLPLDKTVEVSATFAKTGELSYACGMDMIHGVMTVN